MTAVKKDDIAIVRKFAKPHQRVRDIGTAVLYVLSEKKKKIASCDEWSQVQKLWINPKTFI